MTEDFFNQFSNGRQIAELIESKLVVERTKVKKLIEETFGNTQHFCSCPEWCTCWEDFWKSLNHN